MTVNYHIVKDELLHEAGRKFTRDWSFGLRCANRACTASRKRIRLKIRHYKGTYVLRPRGKISSGTSFTDVHWVGRKYAHELWYGCTNLNQKIWGAGIKVKARFSILKKRGNRLKWGLSGTFRATLGRFRKGVLNPRCEDSLRKSGLKFGQKPVQIYKVKGSSWSRK